MKRYRQWAFALTFVLAIGAMITLMVSDLHAAFTKPASSMQWSSIRLLEDGGDLDTWMTEAEAKIAAATGTWTGGAVTSDANLADGVNLYSAPEVADGNNAIRAYDVDGTEFTDILRWSNGNTPTVVLGAATVQFSLASTGLDVSTAGAISNATTIQGTGNATMAGYTFGTTGSSLYTAVVDINDAEIVALRETPFTLVAAPGANSYVEVVSCQLIFDYGSGTAYAESADNLIIGYDDGSTQIGNTLEMTGFIDQTADMILPWVNSATARAASLLVNKNVALKNSGDGEIVTGDASDGALRVIISYRVHTSLSL
jgi:hypothetical protein